MPSWPRIVRGVRRRLRAGVNPWLLTWTGRQLKLEETLVIAGSNRSGTTWLQEVVAELPGSVTMFEPLHVDAITSAARAGFHKLSYFPAETDHPAAEAYMRQVLSGQRWHGYSARLNSMSACWRPQRAVVKFIHANGLLDWMTARFPIRQPLVVLRHPAAVNSSVLNLNWDLSELQTILLRSELVQASPDLQRYVRSLKTPVEQLTARWCLENAVLLKSTSRRFHLVTYESLVCGGPAALMELFQLWGLEAPASVAEAFARDSELSAVNRSYANAQQRLSKWKSELSQTQVNQILAVLQEFGLDFYTDAILPDPAALERCRAAGILDNAMERLRAA
ncbi:MAG: sulfotransferase [Planctomycetaceae bacterium]|nr:sulfotransferase [Planctomycetaceae bacterium]